MTAPPAGWTRVAAVADLEIGQPLAARVKGKAIAVFRTADNVFACDDRCPHQGFPLSELGCVDRDGMLTCAMHNWQYSLHTGDSRFGGNRLRLWPTRVADGDVWVGAGPLKRGQTANRG